MSVKKYIPTLIRAVEAASEKIMEIYSTDFEVEIKSDNSPVTIADKLSSDIILSHLSVFDIPIVSEEEEKMEFELRKSEPLIWLIDPIDGTKEFIKKNDQFCINIALIENGKPVLGLIASPTEKTIIFGGESIGAFEVPYHLKEGHLERKWGIEPHQNDTQKVLMHSNAGFSGSIAKFVRNLETKYGKMQVIKKGSALKFFDLVRGTADFYARFAPTMEWDIAAGQAIYEAVGGEVFHAETKVPLTYNKPQLKNPYFIAKRKKLNL